MATSAAVSSYIKDITKCAICLGDFTNPRSLPCLHSFCLDCLASHYKAKSAGDKAICPMCRDQFDIPANGVQGLKHNFFLEGLVNVRKASVQKTISEPCAVCQTHGDEGTVATTYCVDCRQKLCERCSRPHKLWRGGGHQVVALGEEVSVELLRKTSSYCEQHKDEVLKMYCKECQSNMCLMCFAVKHRQHECEEIEQVATEFKERLTTDEAETTVRIIEIAEETNRLDMSMYTFTNHVDDMEKRIRQTGEDIKLRVDRNVRELVQQLEKLKTETGKELTNRREELDLALTAMESFKNYSVELRNKGTCSDITRSANELHTRACELLKTHVKPVQYIVPTLTFTPQTPLRVSLVGTISVGAGTTGQPVQQRVRHSSPRTTHSNVIPADKNISPLSHGNSYLMYPQNCQYSAPAAYTCHHTRIMHQECRKCRLQRTTRKLRCLKNVLKKQ